jgi:glycosyltransferase involved in cell wall biosynthesis
MEKISVIIPTLNEQEHLPLLLNDLHQQSHLPYEIIVVDAHSTDQTATKAQQFPNIKFVQTRPNVGHQRHLGAQTATGDILVFLDADTNLKSDTLEQIHVHFTKHKLDIACPFYIPHQSTIPISAVYFFFNALFFLTQKIFPSGAGSCIIVRNEMYRKYGGFDSQLTYDDIELIRRIGSKTKFAILPIKIYVSDRRFRKYGVLRMFGLYMLLSLLFCFNQFKLANKIKYQFDIYRKQ